MPENFNIAPYYDDYDRSKNYVQMLAVPGRAEQAREFTQQGTMLLDHIGRIGDSVHANGDIIEGCDIVIQGTRVVIGSGRIWLDGLVRIIPETELTISGVGPEFIGARIIRTIVTESQDSSLRDPAQGYENYGLEGAHRVKEDVEFAVNADGTAIIYRLMDGRVVNEATTSGDSITDTLARRTFDENGNYKIEGLNLSDRAETVDDMIVINLTAGKAYIKGYEVVKSYNTQVKINMSKNTRSVINEPKKFESGKMKYKLNNTPVESVGQVSATVEVSEEMTRGSIAGGTDYLSNTPVVEIVRVWDSSNEYISGVDYQLSNDGVDWSLSGKDPQIGSTYYVTYRYNALLEEETDYTVSVDSDGESYITFTGTGRLPVNGRPVDIDYDFYLYRIDVVLLDKEGNIHILEGKSEIGRLVKVPENGDPSLLPIGYVQIFPNSSKIIINNYHTVRMSQSDMYNLSRRLDDMEYNQAITDLDQEAIDGEAATDLKGIFTDGFIGATKIDLSHPDNRCSIDIVGEYLTLPVNQNVTTVNPDLGLIDTIVGQRGRIIMCPYVDEVKFNQPKATKPFLVNPYAVYNPLSLVSLDPAVDNWVDPKVNTINQTTTENFRFTGLSAMRQWLVGAGLGRLVEGSSWRAIARGEEAESQSTVSTTERIVSQSAIEYMRPTQVKVTGSNFTPYEDNIVCYFDGKQIPLKPLSGTSAGTLPNTVKVGADGKFKASFTVPAKTPCGTVNVKLEGSTCVGENIYRAEGKEQIIERTVLTVRNVGRYVDPLAQSFSATEDFVLSKIGLFFAAKDPSKAVVVQIRNMVNGYPGSECYAEVTVESSDIITSANSSVMTTVTLDQPVYCREGESYCVCLLSDSNAYQVWVAELGEKDILTKQYVTSQPYAEGVMFSSSNAVTWTAHQTMDIKMQLISMNFTSDAEIYYDNVSELQVTQIILAASYIDYKNNGIEWFYRTSGSSSWIPIEAFSSRDLGNVTTNIQVRCIIRRGFGVSPMIASDTLNLIGIAYDSQGAYVSREVTMDEAYNNVRVVLESDMKTKTATNFEVYIMASDDPSNAGWRHLTGPEVSVISEEYNRYEYNLEGLNAKKYRVKIEMTTSNPAQQPRIRRLMSILKY